MTLTKISRNTLRGVVGRWTTRPDDSPEREITMKKLSDVNQVMLDDIATYMVDEIREQVHYELAPCMPEEFLTRYLHLDPEFEELLSEFNIDVVR